VSEKPSPIKSLSSVDKGDETLHRYRYQAACAALFSLDLLDINSEFEELFCEQYEDILILLKGGTFAGIQVKTREPKLGPFSFGDTEVQDSFKRFVELEAQFPEKFSRYVICSNCDFWAKRKDSTNPVYCLDEIRENTHINMDFVIIEKIGKIADATKTDHEFVLKVLKKVRLQRTMDLYGFEEKLTKNVSVVVGKEKTYETIYGVALALINTMLRKSSLPQDSSKNGFLEFLQNPRTLKVESTIEDKRVTKKEIETLVANTLTSTTLRMAKPMGLLNLPKGMKKLELKMANGGLSALDIDNEKDLKYSAEMLLTNWFHRKGPEETESRYENLCVIVRNECIEAMDLLKSSAPAFGTEMLNEVRRRLREKHSNNVASIYPDCAYEHLLGIAGILTEECKVWWSEEFPIPEETS
jgi:hypothetical protein